MFSVQPIVVSSVREEVVEHQFESPLAGFRRCPLLDDVDDDFMRQLVREHEMPRLVQMVGNEFDVGMRVRAVATSWNHVMPCTHLLSPPFGDSVDGMSRPPFGKVAVEHHAVRDSLELHEFLLSPPPVHSIVEAEGEDEQNPVNRSGLHISFLLGSAGGCLGGCT